MNWWPGADTLGDGALGSKRWLDRVRKENDTMQASEEHPDARERADRIGTVNEDGTRSKAGLPSYRSHKVVQAMKIAGVLRLEEQAIGSDKKTVSYLLTAEGLPSMSVSQTWHDQHSPEVGGYYVCYEDGYISYSPAKAFEEGYTEVGQDVTEFQLARMTMKREFNADREPGEIYGAYHANVAMLLSDRFGIKDHAKRNEAAAAVMDLIFDLQDTPTSA